MGARSSNAGSAARVGRACALAAALALSLALAGCSGDGEDREIAARLDELRGRQELAVTYDERERLVRDALAFAQLNQGTPAGGEAFAIARSTLLDAAAGGEGRLLADEAPPLPDDVEGEYEIGELRAMAGFRAICPESYAATAMVAEARMELIESAADRTRILEDHANGRLTWAKDIRRSGRTGSPGGRLSSDTSEAEYLRGLLDDLGQSTAMHRLWTYIVAAARLAEDEPSSSGGRYENGTMILSYTNSEVTRTERNARQILQKTEQARAALKTVEAE